MSCTEGSPKCQGWIASSPSSSAHLHHCDSQLVSPAQAPFQSPEQNGHSSEPHVLWRPSRHLTPKGVLSSRHPLPPTRFLSCTPSSAQAASSTEPQTTEPCAAPTMPYSSCALRPSPGPGDSPSLTSSSTTHSLHLPGRHPTRRITWTGDWKVSYLVSKPILIVRLPCFWQDKSDHVTTTPVSSPYHRWGCR